MIPLTNYDFQGSGEQGSVVIKFTQIYLKHKNPTSYISNVYLPNIPTISHWL